MTAKEQDDACLKRRKELEAKACENFRPSVGDSLICLCGISKDFHSVIMHRAVGGGKSTAQPEWVARAWIAEVAKSWIGTPFFPHMAKKGVGCDCVQLARAVFVEAGAVPESVTFPKYSLDGGNHLQKSTVIEWLKKSPLFECYADACDVSGLDHRCVQPGDILTFEIGRVPHHVGIATGGGKFVQSIRDYGVGEYDLRDSTWAKRLRSVWRLKCSDHREI